VTCRMQCFYTLETVAEIKLRIPYIEERDEGKYQIHVLCHLPLTNYWIYETGRIQYVWT
jgi:hypothetical protein